MIAWIFERLCTVNVDPAEAAIMAISASHCIGVSNSLRNRIPEKAAIAGSMLINVPKVLAGSRVNAIISSE